MHSLRSFIIAATLLCVGHHACADEAEWLVSETNPASTIAENGLQRSSVSEDAPRSQPSLRKVGGALAVVLGGFFLMTIFMRKQNNTLLANEMMEPLGSVQIAPKVRLHMVRFGSRILVLHIAGQNVQRVAELEDPEEVAKFLASKSDGATVPVSVGELLQSVERAPFDQLRGTPR